LAWVGTAGSLAQIVANLLDLPDRALGSVPNPSFLRCAEPIGMVIWKFRSMQKLKPWHALLATGLAVAGCRYRYELLPVHSDGGGAGSAGEMSSAGSSAATDAGASVGGAPDGAGSGNDGNMAGGDATSAGEGGGTSLAGTGGSSGSATGGGGVGGGGTGVPPDMALCNQVSYGGHDYLLCQEQRPWEDANNGCIAIGMRLVRVDDANENQWLFTNANTPNGQASEVWLGASDRAVEGEWRWSDGELFWVGDPVGTPQNGLFDAWYFREPNNVNDEDCAALETAAKPEWYDHHCELSLSYVCESL
jgi:hypothetical protein